jgi:hypothetical protein
LELKLQLQEGKPVVSEPYLLADVYNPAQYQEDIDETLWLSSYVPEMKIDEVMRPMFDFLFPILADAHDKIEWVDGWDVLNGGSQG